MDDPHLNRTDLRRLLDLIARLRAPDGCPWDRRQTLVDLRAYLLEEAHETAAALDSGDRSELAGELGDLLFQVAFIARLAEEEGSFTAAEAIDRVHDKMVARHPHVFGPESDGDDGARRPADAAAVERAWERRKLDETGEDRSLLAGVPASLPALTGAYRMTQKAAGVGFDWPDATAVLAKVDEELAELRAEIGAIREDAARGGTRRVAAELGDLLFTVANLGRKLGIDPEAALAGTNAEFRRRFAHIEVRLAADGRRPDDSSLAEMDALWREAKGLVQQ